ILKTLEKFKLNIDTIDAIKNVFIDEMQIGLSSTTTKKSCLQMENTFIPYLPTGEEKGFYLSLDLGSTNFRVILSKLTGNEENDEFVVKYYDIPEEYKVAKSSQKLFEHIANCIHDFLSCLPELNGLRIPLGFTFSFPMVQKAIDIGLLVTWTKCYDLPDVVDKNAVEFLQKALSEKVCNERRFN
ncbi:hexokinase-2-like isoform X3, partial [Leptotrombidium deliense]